MKAQIQALLRSYGLSGDERLKLSEAGLDSLAVVELLDELGQLDHISEETSLALLDTDLLQSLTVREVSELAEIFERDGNLELSLSLLIGQMSDSHRKLVQRTMTQDSSLGFDSATLGSERSDKRKIALVTGATGFIGTFLLACLLERTDWNISCLVRAVNDAHATDRLVSELQESKLLTPNLRKVLDARVTAVAGDLSQSNFGLSTAAWNSLASSVDVVVHNGAMVDYVRNYDVLRPHNVEGTRYVLEFCGAVELKQLHYVSSTIIFGWTPKEKLFESDTNIEMMNLDFGYSQTKWVAERLVLEARGMGIDANIFRPSFLTASQDGVGNSADIVIRLLAFMVNNEVIPNAENQISFLPVDVAADCIAGIIALPGRSNRNYHVTADDYYNLGHITDEIADQLGCRFTPLSTHDFIEELKRRCGRDDPMYPLLEFSVRSYGKVAGMEQKRYDNSEYRKARAVAYPTYREPELSETVRFILKHMNGDNLIDVTQRAQGTKSGRHEQE